MIGRTGIVVLLAVAIICCFALTADAKLRERECEVCIKVVDALKADLKAEKKEKASHEDIEKMITKSCKKFKDSNQEDRFCWAIGAKPDSATSMLRSVSVPLKNGVPSDKICERLKDKDATVCALMFEKKVDVNNVDLNKLRVKELKSILSSWGEQCEGCIDKNQYIARINALKGKHAPPKDL